MCAMEIVRAVVVDRHIDDVFEYLADPRNDRLWCPGVVAVRQLAGDGPGLAGRWELSHRPRLRRARLVTRACVAWEPPGRLGWRDDDGGRLREVVYELEPVWTATRVTRRDAGHGVRRDATRRMRELRRALARA
jgi:polyketide cyclase/dehydrase/lipid transport protein